MRCFSPLPKYWDIALVLSGILVVGSWSWSLSANLLQVPSFEDGSPRVLSCTERYSAQNGFQLCFETDAECGFEAVKNARQSCDAVCAAGGGQCLRAYGNDSSNPCVAVSEPANGCARTDRYDDICVCSVYKADTDGDGVAAGANSVQDPSFENRGARVLDLADQTDWFGEDKNRTLIVQGNARTGNNFLRLTGGGPQAKVFQRVALKPNTNYTFSFYSRGAASASFTGSVRARFTGVCYVHKPPEECPGGGECCDSVPCCPDIEIEPEGYEEDFDLGPEPPDYKKLILGGVEASGSSDWQFNVVTFNTGKYTEDGIVFYSEAPSDDIDIDDVSLTEGP